MKCIRQVIRGCRDIPHVGKHPGTAMLIALIICGALAGREGGWIGLMGGAAFMALFMLPIYLCGAYSRANLSDSLDAQDALNNRI